MCERFIYCLLLGLALSRFVDCRKFDINKLNVTALHKPQVSATGMSRAGFQPFWDPNFCNDWQDLDAFPHPDSCAEYLICWQGELWEQECPPGMLFDPWDAFCDYEEYVVCLDDLPEGPWPDDDLCPPPGSNEVRFLPSLYCDEFYICINGQPVLLQCRPGQHWNVYEEFCDDPINAGCDPNGNPDPDHPGQLPNCPWGFTGQLPHPSNCNWFIHCNNGNRSIQQCQHLHHFDLDQGRCIVKTQARCINQARFRHGARN